MSEREAEIRRIHTEYGRQEAEEVCDRLGYAAVEDLLRCIDGLRAEAASGRALRERVEALAVKWTSEANNSDFEWRRNAGWQLRIALAGDPQK